MDWRFAAIAFAWLTAGSLLLGGCRAHFDPLPDDDSADDDDTATDDDDVTDDDDDSVDSLFDSETLQLQEGEIYTLVLLGKVNDSPPASVWSVVDQPTGATGGQPAFRFIHAAAGMGPVDWYIDGTTPDAALSAMTPASIYPPQAAIGYLSLGDPGTYKIDVYPPGSTYGVDPAIVGDYIDTYNGNVYYTLWLTGAQGYRTVARSVDDVSPPQAGNARVRIFHSVEDLAALDATIEVLANGQTLSLWDDVALGEMGNPWEVPAGNVILHVFNAY